MSFKEYYQKYHINKDGIKTTLQIDKKTKIMDRIGIIDTGGNEDKTMKQLIKEVVEKLNDSSSLVIVINGAKQNEINEVVYNYIECYKSEKEAKKYNFKDIKVIITRKNQIKAPLELENEIVKTKGVRAKTFEFIDGINNSEKFLKLKNELLSFLKE